MEEELPTPQPTPTKLLVPVIGKEQAKKRLRAFQLSKQVNASASTSKNPIRPLDALNEASQEDDCPSTSSSSAPSEDLKKKRMKGVLIF